MEENAKWIYVVGIIAFILWVIYLNCKEKRDRIRRQEEEKAREWRATKEAYERVRRERAERERPQYLQSSILGGIITLFDAFIREPKWQDEFRISELTVKTKSGEMVRSQKEAMIADYLYDNNISYQYEPVLCLRNEDGPCIDGTLIRRPDFAILNPRNNKLLLWEHCGMLSDEKYKERWERKKKLYLKHQIKEGTNLIITDDTIDESDLRRILSQAFAY